MNILSYDPLIRCVDFHPDDPDEAVEKFIVRCEEKTEIATWRMCFAGFDDDPRELIEIPEANEFAKRLIDLGILITLIHPQPKGAYIFQNDTPGLDGLTVHAISRGIGDVRRRGKRVNIGFDVDIVGYFMALLNTCKQRKVPQDIIEKMERLIERQTAFDPLRGSGRFAADSKFEKEMLEQPSQWNTFGIMQK